MKILAGIVIVALISCAAYGQQKKPAEHYQRIDWQLLAADATVRSYDVYSTHYALTHGGHETLLPNVIAAHPALMAVYSGGGVALDWFVTNQLIKHHHRKLARIYSLVDTGQVFAETIGNRFPPHHQVER